MGICVDALAEHGRSGAFLLQRKYGQAPNLLVLVNGHSVQILPVRGNGKGVQAGEKQRTFGNRNAVQPGGIKIELGVAVIQNPVDDIKIAHAVLEYRKDSVRRNRAKLRAAPKIIIMYFIRVCLVQQAGVRLINACFIFQVTRKLHTDPLPGGIFHIQAIHFLGRNQREFTAICLVSFLLAGGIATLLAKNFQQELLLHDYGVAGHLLNNENELSISAFTSQPNEDDIERGRAALASIGYDETVSIRFLPAVQIYRNQTMLSVFLLLVFLFGAIYLSLFL